MTTDFDVWVVQPCDCIERIKMAIDTFNGCQSFFRAHWCGESAPGFARGIVEWPADERPLSSRLGNGRPVLTFTSAVFRDNWFSHGTASLGIVSTHRWLDDFNAAHVDAYALFQLTLAAYYGGCSISENECRPHIDQTIGCLLDMCCQKSDIVLGMRCAYVCPEHRNYFVQAGGSTEALQAIERILDTNRHRVLGRPLPHAIGSDASLKSGQGAALFSWVHLSDIHVGHGDANHVEDQKLVLDALARDIRSMCKRNVPKPDVIMVTGDIAFSGACRSVDEYERARVRLTDLASQVGLDARDILLVPGNHDVQRAADADRDIARLIRQLRDGTESLDDALASESDRAKLARRQENFLAFSSSFGMLSDEVRTSRPLWWRQSFVARSGLRVRVVGLNTALLAADEARFGSDHKVLRLGKTQLSAAFGESQAPPDDLIVTLSHHPLRGGWLADEAEADGWIRAHADVHLSGHVHEATTDQLRSGGGTDLIAIAAGAVHGEPTLQGVPARHGYSFGAVIASNSGAKLRVWPRMWSHKRKDFRADIDNLEDGALSHDLGLPRIRIPTVNV